MIAKRLFDFVFSLVAIIVLSWILVILFILCSIDTRSNGLFRQNRIGRYGKFFSIYKFKTIHPETRKISAAGRFIRNSKLDEFPQLFNVLKGDMSLVGPRPDVSGYYDALIGEDRRILKLRPGITGPASLKYADEEKLLLSLDNPKEYNDEVIFPDKLKINLEYQASQSFWLDIRILFYTIAGKRKIEF